MKTYIASYGGSGSWILVNYLRSLGVDCYHTHNRFPPKFICDITFKKEFYNKEFKKFWGKPKEKEVFNYNSPIKEGNIIFIYRKPIYTLLSLKSGNLSHFENLEINPSTHKKLMELGFDYNDKKIHLESLKKYFQLKKDIINYKEIFDNYYNCTWNKNYNILSINFDYLWDNIKEICKFVGKEYNEEFPQKQKREYNQNIISLSDKVFGEINSTIDISNNIKIIEPQEYTLSDKDIINSEVKIMGLEGNRIKHFLERDEIQVYNERDVLNKNTNTKYGRLRIKFPNSNKWKIKEFGDKLNLKVNFGGVEDPRIFKFNNNIFVLMNGVTKSTSQREMYLYNINKDTIVKLWVTNQLISRIREQKNWSPYVYKDELYFIYSFNELCVLKVIDIEKGECKVVKGNPLKHNDSKKIYGSTSFVPWNFPYYIGFAHTRIPWRAVPITYNAESMKIVKIGKVINFSNPKEAIPWREKSVQFPYDLRIKNGEIILGIEFEDRCPTLLSIDYISFCKQFKI